MEICLTMRKYVSFYITFNTHFKGKYFLFHYLTGVVTGQHFLAQPQCERLLQCFLVDLKWMNCIVTQAGIYC